MNIQLLGILVVLATVVWSESIPKTTVKQEEVTSMKGIEGKESVTVTTQGTDSKEPSNLKTIQPLPVTKGSVNSTPKDRKTEVPVVPSESTDSPVPRLSQNTTDDVTTSHPEVSSSVDTNKSEVSYIPTTRGHRTTVDFVTSAVTIEDVTPAVTVEDVTSAVTVADDEPAIESSTACAEGFVLPFSGSDKCYKLKEFYGDRALYKVKDACEDEVNGADLANGIPDEDTHIKLLKIFKKEIGKKEKKALQRAVIYPWTSPFKAFGPNPEPTADQCAVINIQTSLWEPAECTGFSYEYAICEIPRN